MPTLLDVDLRRGQGRSNHKDHGDHKGENHEEEFASLICTFFFVHTPSWPSRALWLDFSRGARPVHHYGRSCYLRYLACDSWIASPRLAMTFVVWAAGFRGAKEVG